jgi:hypothetical protein
MKNLPFFMCVVIAGYLFASQGANGQDVATRFRKQHIRGTEPILVKALETKSPAIQRGILQHIRFLEWAYPDEEFGIFVEPLSNLLKDENADVQSRMLAALALESLHTDKADAIIKETASSAANQSLRELCSSIMVEPSDGRQ